MNLSMKNVWIKNHIGEMNIKVDFSLMLNRTSGKTTIRVAAADVFRLTVNGHLVGYGPRRLLEGVSAINEYDITKFVSKRKSSIKVEVVSYQNDAFYLADEPPFFAAEIENDGKIICDSFSFEARRDTSKIQKVHRYSVQRNFTESYDHTVTPAEKEELVEVKGNELRYCDLPYPAFEISRPRLIENGYISRLKKYEPFPIPFTIRDKVNMKKYPLDEMDEDVIYEISPIVYNRKKELCELKRDFYQTYAFRYTMTGFINLSVSVDDSAEIYLIFDETLNTEHFRFPEGLYENQYKNGALPIYFHRLNTVNIVKYKLIKGKYNLSSIEPYSLKYLRIIVVGDAQIVSVSLNKYENSDAYLRKNTIKDKKLHRIYTAAQRTFAQCSVDYLIDCPSRERAAWLCDSYFSGRAEYYFTGNNRIEKNLLNAFLEAPPAPMIPEGMIPMCYFNNKMSDEHMPTWAFWFILELEEYYNRTGDKEFILKFMPKVTTLIDGMLDKHLNEYSLLEDVSGWLFIEWSRANDFTEGVSFPTNMLFSKALKCAANLFGIERYAGIAEKMEKSIKEISFNGSFFVDNAVRVNGVLTPTENISETCQYYAFYMGIAGEEEYKKLFDVIFTEFGAKRDDQKVYPNVHKSNAFIGDLLRLDYLFKIGRADQTISECKDYYYHMTKRTGTLWEHETPIASMVHCFCSLVAEWIDAYENMTQKSI